VSVLAFVLIHHKRHCMWQNNLKNCIRIIS